MKMMVLSLLLLSPLNLFAEDPSAKLVPLKKELMKNLQGKLKTEGPVKALEFCHLNAQKITAANQQGIEIGRTSHRLRNAKNAPRDWVKPYLSEFVSGKRKEAIAIKLKNGKRGYLEPIRISKGACLICHGSSLSKPLQSELEKRYPQDQATGFKMNDFRGLFWMEY